MRVDYGLYVIAIMCFIIASLPYTNIISEKLLTTGSFTSIALTVIFTALGLILIILGYSLRPKPIISIPEALQSTLPPTPPPSPLTEGTTATPLSEPTPTPLPQKETAKPERKKSKTRTRRKGTRKRRKKV